MAARICVKAHPVLYHLPFRARRDLQGNKLTLWASFGRFRRSGRVSYNQIEWQDNPDYPSIIGVIII
jgi:hypothetical protein